MLQLRFFHFFLTCCFVLTSIAPASRVYAAENILLNLPAPGSMVVPSQNIAPVMLKGLHINPKEPLVLDFLVSKGDVIIEKGQYSQEIEQLAKYFLASMAIPENELWVNLSPFEKEKIITDSLSKTEMGQHMLAQDYLLKQLTASMIYPEKELGKQFWARVYTQARKQFGSAEIPVNTFNKVWILADTATAVEKNNAVLITDTRLKVMLEEDFLALKRNEGRVTITPATNQEHIVASNIIRQIILPEIEKEVNTGANFAPLRQIFHAFVLATWYKKTLKQAILNEVYTDKSKIGGIEALDLQAKQKIYDRYVQAYKKGVFNYIKEEDNGQQRRIPRKYFSGGERITSENTVFVKDAGRFDVAMAQGGLDRARVSFDFQPDNAMIHTVAVSNTMSVLESVDATKIEALNNFWLRQARQGRPNHHVTNITALKISENIKDLVAPFLPTPEAVNQIKVIQLNVSPIRQRHSPFKHGYAIDRDNKTIYVTDEFARMIEEYPSGNGMYQFYARKIIYIFGLTSEQGRRNEHDFIQRDPELSAALTYLFPSDVPLPGEIKRSMSKEFFLANETDPKRIVEAVKAQAREAGVSLDRYDIIEPTQGDIQANQAAEKSMYESLDIIAINAMDGIVDYRNSFPAEHSSLLYSRSAFNAVGFFSKLNPITIAHVVVTMLSVYARTGADGYFFSPTKKDPRKPEVEMSYEARLGLSRSVTEKMFQKLLTLLNVNTKIKIQNREYDLSEWNGEETMALLLLYARQNPSLKGKSSSMFYPYGSDHHFVFALDKDPEKIAFDVVDDKYGKYLTFFLDTLPGGAVNYAKLIKRQHQLSKEQGARKFYSEEAVDNNRKRFIDRILAAESSDGSWNKDAIIAAVSEFKILPRLDVVGKMLLLQEEVGEFARIVLAHTFRKEDYKADPLRDEYIRKGEIQVTTIPGLDGGISATNIRRALELFAYGKVNLGAFGGVTFTTLVEVLSEKNRDLLDFLLRQAGVTLSRSLSSMIKLNPEVEAERVAQANDIKDKMQEESGWRIIESSIPFEMDKGKIKPGASRVMVTNKDFPGYHVEVIYQVQEQFSASGEKSTTIKYRLSAPPNMIIDTQRKQFHIDENLLQYIEVLNGAQKAEEDSKMDFAMIGEEAKQVLTEANNLGGIELNNKDLNLNIAKDGQGITFDIDPQLLEQLRSDSFGGFKPTVLDITPMSVSSPILN